MPSATRPIRADGFARNGVVMRVGRREETPTPQAHWARSTSPRRHNRGGELSPVAERRYGKITPIVGGSPAVKVKFAPRAKGEFVSRSFRSFCGRRGVLRSSPSASDALCRSKAAARARSSVSPRNEIFDRRRNRSRHSCDGATDARPRSRHLNRPNRASRAIDRRVKSPGASRLSRC